MNPAVTVLLQSDDPEVIAMFRAILEEEGEVRLVVAPPGRGMALALDAPTPAFAVVDAAGHYAGGLAGMPWAEDTSPDSAAPLVLRLERGRTPSGGIDPGAHDILMWPAPPPVVSARIATLLRLVRAEGTLAQAIPELKRLRAAEQDARAPIAEVLGRALEAALPAAAGRAERIASLAWAIAARFEVPDALIDDLGHAARLHELGLIGQGLGACPPPPHRGSAEGWHYAARTRAILEGHPALEGAASLVGDLYENWDGTGQPRHLLQGQIPLRSRILRVLVDLTALLEGPEAQVSEQVVDSLDEYAGTLYDPMVIVHLRALVAEVPGADQAGRRSRVPISELEAGMVLAEDLYTDSGLKLLARETVLTSGTLDIIRRRHQVEPIDQGAAIRRCRAS